MTPTGTPQSPRVSVVMCTVNRPDLIGQAVRSVLACDHESFELVVVDQSSDSKTQEALESLRGDPRLRYLHTDRVGLSAAYNAGISEASSELLAFTDDDCLVPPGWLKGIERAFDEVQDADLLYGTVLEAPGMSGHDRYVPALTMPRRTRISRSDGFRIYGMGANFAARRRLFDKIGGFDEVLGGGGPLRSSQDHDLSYRAYKAGLVTLLEPTVELQHLGVRTREQWPQLFRAYGIGDAAFRLKHVRCGDGLAIRLFVTYAAELLARSVVRAVGRKPNALVFLRAFVEGSWLSFRYKVDRTRRVYVAR
jgi:glycosyltransferase involved in cell wall biosynthesis